MDQIPIAKFIKDLCRICGVLFILSMAGNATASSLLEGIQLSENPSMISLRFNEDVTWRVYQTGSRELLIALEDAAVAKDLTRSGSGAPVIQRIVYKRSEGGNATLLVETGVDIHSVESYWRSGVRILDILLETVPVRLAHKEPRTVLRKRKPLVTIPISPEVPDIRTVAEKSSPPSAVKGIEISTLSPAIGYGGIDTLLDAILQSDCGESIHVRIGIRNIREGNCEEGLDALAQGLMEGCDDVFSYLDIWCRFGVASTPLEFLSLVRDLNALLVQKPDSSYIPWGYAMLGVLYHKMENDPVGMGYFDLLNEKVPTFAGMPEVFFYLGRMHMRSGNMEKAEFYLRDLVARFGDTIFAREARMELGRVMFARKRYFDTLEILEVVVQETPDRMLTDSDLLILIGNSHFHTGGYVQAIEALARSYNSFPDLAEPALVLTRIAESYAGLKENEKARHLYQMVRDLYPGTDGYVVSSMRLAEMLEDREEREEIFKMIIDTYPDHTLARLALMRLAESRYQVEDYNETVNLIRRVFVDDPSALRREALGLMGRALEAMFQEFLAEGAYLEVIRRYEVEKTPVFEMESPRIHALAGRAFLEGHLYSQALPEYQRAEMLWGGAVVPPDFYFEYGVVSMEMGEKEKALDYFTAFLGGVSGNPDRKAEAWNHIGDIRYGEEKKVLAMEAYETAVNFASQGQKKAQFLHAISKILRDGKEREKEAETLERGLVFLDEKGQDSPELRFALLRSLGESQVAQGNLDAGALAYEKAEILPGILAVDKNAVRFRFAETLEALGNSVKAEGFYRLLVEDGDPLWSALARERLAVIGIEKQLLAS